MSQMRADYVCRDCGARVINEVAEAPSRNKDCPYCGGNLSTSLDAVCKASRWKPETAEAFGELARAMGATSITICGTEHQEGEEQMQEFQTRVVEEKSELDEKIAKLQSFVATDVFQSLPNAEQARMSRQLTLK